MFPCCSLNSSHSFLPPRQQVCSPYLSPLLPCIQVHYYHLSRSHTQSLMYNICLSLSDLLHFAQSALGSSKLNRIDLECSWVGQGGIREGGSERRDYMYTCGRFVLMCGRGQHNFVEQLSSNNCILFYTSQYCTISFDNLNQLLKNSYVL